MIKFFVVLAVIFALLSGCKSSAIKNYGSLLSASDVASSNSEAIEKNNSNSA